MENKELETKLQEKKNDFISSIKCVNDRFHELNKDLYKTIENNDTLVKEHLIADGLLASLSPIPHKFVSFGEMTLSGNTRKGIRLQLTDKVGVLYDGKVIVVYDDGKIILIDTNKVDFIEGALETKNVSHPTIPFNELTLTQLVTINQYMPYLVASLCITKDVVDGFDNIIEAIIETL